MCLITFAWQQADCPLVLVANRDEFFARPSQPAHWWQDRPGVYAGRDLRAGGSWLGVSRSGRIAALTNVRDPRSNRSDAQSRGQLVADFLAGDLAPGAYAQQVLRDGERYNGFNLLLADRNAMVYVGNRQSTVRSLQPGVFALSNAALDTPWPKTLSARRKLEAWLARSHPFDELPGLLQDRSLADDDRLPSTGVAHALEKALSAEFIEMPDYGTRSSTALRVDRAGRLEFVERGYQPESFDVTMTLDSFWPD